MKQRREIVGGSALYVDQAPVRAALEGKILILDGIEKAERNVLPTLNNLLGKMENFPLILVCISKCCCSRKSGNVAFRRHVSGESFKI